MFDDKEILKGKREKYEIEAPLRDKSPKSLLKKLKDLNFGHVVDQSWSVADADRAEWLSKRKTYLKDWDQFIPKDGEEEYLHLPISFTTVKTYHARTLKALELAEPLPKARKAHSVDRAPLVGEVMKYSMKDWGNYGQGIRETLDQWVWTWASEGVATMKARWDVKFEKWVDIVTKPTPRRKTSVDKDGNEAFETVVELEESEEERVERIFDGPVADMVMEEDIVLIGGDDPDNADMVIQQVRLTASELNTLADRGIFDREVVNEIIKSGPDTQTDGDSSGVKQERANLGGQADNESAADRSRYRIFEVYASYPVDNSGIDSQIVAWVHPKSREIARATYLRRMNPKGKRPFFRAKFHTRPGSKHPMGLIEVLYPIAKEMDAMHNIRMDVGLITAMPFGFYKPSSTIEADKIQYEPGSLIPLDDPQKDVFFPNLGNKGAFFLQEENGLQTLVERMTGISDLTLGANTTQGALRTATGARALVGESNANIDVHLGRIFEAYRHFLRYWLMSLQLNMPDGLEFKLTGEDGKAYFPTLNRQDIAGEFEFEIDPSSADSNPQVRIDKAIQVLNFTADPINIQFGLVTPSQRFEAAKNFYKALGIKDWTRFIQKPPEHRIVLSPQEEAVRVLNGINVPVSPEQDHDGFVEYFEFIMANQELLGQYNEQQIQALAAQAQQHAQMKQALEEAARQQQNVRQQQQNAAQSIFATQPIQGQGGVA